MFDIDLIRINPESPWWPLALGMGAVIGWLYLVGWYRIMEKAGHSGWLGLLMALPIVNAIVFFWFAYFARWPLRVELADLRKTNPQATETWLPHAPHG